MDEQRKSVKVEYPTRDYAKVWFENEPTRLKTGSYLYGHRLFTKMILFLAEAKFTQEAYDYYRNLPAARQSDESYEEYKLRQKFQRNLERFRKAVKASIFMNLVEDLRKKAEQNEQTKSEEGANGDTPGETN